jgi:predicted site-specific integrase-resolvase
MQTNEIVEGGNEIAARLGVSSKTVYRLFHRGLLRATRFPYKNSPLRTTEAEIERIRREMLGQ